MSELACGICGRKMATLKTGDYVWKYCPSCSREDGFQCPTCGAFSKKLSGCVRCDRPGCSECLVNEQCHPCRVDEEKYLKADHQMDEMKERKIWGWLILVIHTALLGGGM